MPNEQSAPGAKVFFETYNDVAGSQVINTATMTKSVPSASSEITSEEVPKEAPSTKEEEREIPMPNLDQTPIAESPLTNERPNTVLKGINKLVDNQENSRRILRVEAGAGGRGGSGIEADECLIEGCEGTGGKGGNGGGLNLPDFYQGAMNIEAKYGEGGLGGSGIKAKKTTIRNSKAYGGEGGEGGK